MAKITITETRTVQGVLDTDTFSRQEWIDFIKVWVPFRDIQRAVKYDLFPGSKLKAIAIYNATHRIEF